MKLLATAISGAEARSIAGLADLLDVKDPLRGPLGAPAPSVVREIRLAIGPEAPLSAALGDMDGSDIEGCAGLALRISASGAGWLKVGLSRVSVDVAIEGLLKLKEALAGRARLTAVAYADGGEFGFFPCSALPTAARQSGLDGIMLDTYSKSPGKSLLDFITPDRAKAIIGEGRSLGLATALAGGLNLEHVERLSQIGPDWIGFRGAITSAGDRKSAGIDRQKLTELAEKIRAVAPAAL